jgi:hypothetical protein
MALSIKQIEEAKRAVYKLDRNDLDGALNIVEDLAKNGGIPEDLAETISYLFDDPSEYFDKVREIAIST